MNRKVVVRLKSLLSPNSLKNQLLYRSLLILAVLLVLIGLLQYVFMRDVVYRNRAAAIQTQIMSVPANAWLQLGLGVGSAPPRQPFFFIPGANLALIDADGSFTILMSGPDGVNPPQLEAREYLDIILNKKPSRRGEPNYRVVNDGGIQQLVVLEPIAAGPGRVLGIIQVSTPTGPLKELLAGQLLQFLLLSLLAMVGGLVAFLPVLRKTLVPLSNMVKTAEQINAGNLDRRFPIRQGQMEIDRLAESFNGMMERLETSFAAERETKEQMRRFIADASHELRTPLTSIRGFLDVLFRGAAQQPEQLFKALKSMRSESERLNKLVHDLLLLAKLEREPCLELAEGSLDAVIREMEPQFTILAGLRRLSLEIEPDMNCKYDVDKIKQVILNLFQNAVQHTDPEKGEIRISLAAANNGVLFTVQDNGPGIAAEHLPHIFDRFYRSDTSRARKHGGSGLGLAITKHIVDAHGGTISVVSREGEGSTFQVWLPV